MKVLAHKDWGTLHLSEDPLIRMQMALTDSQGRFQAEADVRTGLEQLDILEDNTAGRPPDVVKNEYTLSPIPDVQSREQEILAGVPGVRVPRLLSYDEFKSDPFFPCVTKGGQHGGQGIFLLYDARQFAEYEKTYLPDNMFTIGAPRLTDVKFQQYIPTPGERFSSYRVLVSAAGDILAGGLLYSGHTKKMDCTTNHQGLHYPFVDAGTRSGTAFLRCVSNSAQGGSIVPLGASNPLHLTPMQQEACQKHGIDPSHPQLPAELARQAKAITAAYGRHLGLMVGIDFIQHAQTGDFYYLETNSGPNLQTYILSHCPEGADKVEVYATLMRQIIDGLLQQSA